MSDRIKEAIKKIQQGEDANKVAEMTMAGAVSGFSTSTAFGDTRTSIRAKGRPPKKPSLKTLITP